MIEIQSSKDADVVPSSIVKLEIGLFYKSGFKIRSIKEVLI